MNLAVSFTNMEVLSSPNITRAVAVHPQKKGRKRSIGTFGNEKQKGQAEKRQRSDAPWKKRDDQDQISEETDNFVATIAPSLISSNCNAEAAKKEGKENHELAQNVADSPCSNNPIDHEESLFDEKCIEFST